MALGKVDTAVAPHEAADLSDANSTASKQPTTFEITEKALDDAFNDIWANNANAISHCYSNTDALKVDFTRTGKRSFLGMINDATNSVYRMVQGAVTDFFRQTVLDFIYGSIGLNGLERYYDDLNSRDPSEAVRLARVRASAIETCQREVVPHTETVIASWTLCSPLEPNRIQALKLEEKVVLLTAKALYVCSYDFGNEKLNEFVKVLVGDITSIKQGLYVTNPAESSHPRDNWGLVIHYLRSEGRSNSTASIKNITTKSAASGTDAAPSIFAFRAISDEVEMYSSNKGAGSGSRHLHHTVRSRTGVEDDDDDEFFDSQDKVAHIVKLLAECCADVGAYDPDEPDSFITQGTIQSLDEAKSMMSLFGPLIDGLKRRLWL